MFLHLFFYLNKVENKLYKIVSEFNINKKKLFILKLLINKIKYKIFHVLLLLKEMFMFFQIILFINNYNKTPFLELMEFYSIKDILHELHLKKQFYFN